MTSARRAFLQSAFAPLRQATAAMAFAADDAPVPSLSVHAANRLMFGPTDGDVAAIDSAGYDNFLAAQLDYASIDDSGLNTIMAGFDLSALGETWAQLFDRNSMTYPDNIAPLWQTRTRTWLRILYSKRQLYERMVEFWHTHFSIYARQFIVRSLWPTWDDMIRTHPLGNFRELLEATAMNPCMLYYLDNYISTDGGPNENYARELLELHTLGDMNYQVPGGYIDQDVYESARCFTGWTFDRDDASANRGQFLYIDENHDRFIKYIFETLVPGNQQPLKDGRDVLDMIAYHMGTARHISYKLAKRFVSDNPPQSIVDSTAQAFYDTRLESDQIKQTMRHLLSSDEFKNSRMTKMKRPVDWVASAMRSVPMDYVEWNGFHNIYNPMGMPMFEWRPPDGPPDEMDYWLTTNSLLQRWNWAFRVASNSFGGQNFVFPVDSILPASLDTPRELRDFWRDRIIGREVSTSTDDALLTLVARGGNPDATLSDSARSNRSRYLIAGCMMSPEFMRR